MPHALSLSNFHGPLDLLLQLIEDQKLEITTISLADVTEQFLQYLNALEDHHPDELSDFLVVATKLLLLKAQTLLPYLTIEEEEDPRELETQLRMYKKYADATNVLSTMWEREVLYAKKFVPRHAAKLFVAPSCTVTQLYDVFHTVLERLEPIVRIPKAAMEKAMTLREKLCTIQEALRTNIRMHFHELLAQTKDHQDVVVTFLALLELVKQQVIDIRQDRAFGDITIEKK